MSLDDSDQHTTTSAAAAPPPPPPQAEQQQRKVKGLRRAKHLLRLPFTRSGKRSKRRTPPSPPPPPPPPPYYDGEPRRGCYLCFLPPRSTPDSALQPSPGGASGSKPPTYYDLLKSMIERNDFYSPECNVHREEWRIRLLELDIGSVMLLSGGVCMCGKLDNRVHNVHRLDIKVDGILEVLLQVSLNKQAEP